MTTGQTPRPRAAKTHQALVKAEILILRGLFGYGDVIEGSPPEFGSRLPNSHMKDVLLVGLDIDTHQGYERLMPDQQLHIGISILDTRKLLALVHAPATPSDTTVLSDIIDSHQFTIGNSKYCEKAIRKFRMGRSEPITTSQFPAKLHELTVGRDVILVIHSTMGLHGTNGQLAMLQHLRVDQRAIYIFDTNMVAQWPLQLRHRRSLKSLLETLHVPYDGLHAAGNDAHYTLKVLLMLAVKDAERLQRLHGKVTSAALLRALTNVAWGIKIGSDQPVEQRPTNYEMLWAMTDRFWKKLQATPDGCEARGKGSSDGDVSVTEDCDGDWVILNDVARYI